MTIEEAIRHAYDVAFENQERKECCENHLQLAQWLEELKKIREENSKLKRLLKLALEDMANDRPICEKCKNPELDECWTEDDCSCFEWRYADEVKGLIESDTCTMAEKEIES